MGSKIKSLIADYKLLFKSVPALLIIAYTVATIAMNLAASKVVFQIGNVAGTGGILLSWVPFLCMDTTVKRFGAKAAIMLNCFAAVVDLIVVGFFEIVVLIPGNGQDYTAFNQTLGSVWFILFGSITAFIISGIVNSLLNSAVGKIFKKNPDGKLAFFTRSYVSTYVGQFIDNFLFMFIVYFCFAPKYWGFGMTIATCIGTGLVGAALELLTEVIFSPIGYHVSKKWAKENVGGDWLEAHPLELAK